MVRVLKVYLELAEAAKPEIRRVTVSSETLKSYGALCERMTNLCPVIKGKPFVIQWQDEEGDDIVITSDDELIHATANVDSEIMKIHIRLVKDGSVFYTKKVEYKGKLHDRVVCDSCQGQILGYRFKCMQCEDYDLCFDCACLDKHPAHDMLRLATPSNTPRRWIYDGIQRLWKSMFGHVAFGGKVDEPCTQGSTDDKGARSPPFPLPPPFHEAFLPNQDHMKKIGQSVMDFLKPFGVDVKLDIVPPDCDVKFFNKAGAESEVQKPDTSNVEVKSPNEEKSSDNVAAASTDDVKNADSDKSPQVEKSSSIASEQEKVVSQGDQPKSESQPQMQNPAYPPGGLFQAVYKLPVKKVEAAVEVTAENGWTLLNSELGQKKAEEQKNGATAPASEVYYPNITSVEPEMQTEAEPPKQKTGNKMPTVDELRRLNPDIASALLKMTSMGFTNDGGWLVRLLQAKNGNINDALDSMYPNRR